MLRLPRFTNSAYFSIEQLSSRAPPPSGNLSDPRILRLALSSRVFRRELILLTFDFCAVSDALNVVLLLRHAGFEHFLLLSDGRTTCTALQKAATSTTHIPCFWSGFNDLAAWKWWGSYRGCESATHPRRSCVLEQLQAVRYYVAGQLLQEGANLLFIDLDTVRATSLKPST